MQAIVIEKYGTPDVLELREVENPVPRDNEVLVRVHAASINDWEWQLSQGKPFVNRLLAGLFKPRVRILGCDIAGRVEAIGDAVSAFRPGDEVYGDLCECGFGAFAEYACAPETTLARKPPSMTFEQAAAIPQAAMLAVQGLIDVCRIQAGQKVLLNGAGGGVGTIALQLAKLYADVEVTCVDTAEKLDMLLAMGADHVMDYTREDFTRTGQCYDIILDPKTNRSPFAYARALSPGGTYATVGGSSGRLLQVVLLGRLISIFTNDKHIRMVMLKPNKDLEYMNELFEAGKVLPVIDRTYPLAEVPEAFRHFGAANQKGKIIVTMD